MKGTKALVVVDLQNDFCPGGTLEVKDGDKIVAPINELVVAFEKDGLPIAFTRDWHPRDHCSFKARGGMWPPHCVQGTSGAEFHPSLRVPSKAIVIRKGTSRDRDAYSGFQDTDLAERLRQVGAGELFVGGLATDYCVKNTVIDALRLGFKVYVITDCIRGVNLKRTDSANAVRLMMTNGAKRASCSNLLKKLSRRVALSSSS
jgi:nicotinamidase/pyrazinamidase